MPGLHSFSLTSSLRVAYLHVYNSASCNPCSFFPLDCGVSLPHRTPAILPDQTTSLLLCCGLVSSCDMRALMHRSFDLRPIARTFAGHTSVLPICSKPGTLCILFLKNNATRHTTPKTFAGHTSVPSCSKLSLLYYQYSVYFLSCSYLLCHDT